MKFVSLPRAIAPGHVRCFPVIESVNERYKEYLDILEILPVEKKKIMPAPLQKWWATAARRK